MTKLKGLGATLGVISILTVSALAGEMQGPPCPPSEPGETHGPPCATAQLATEDRTNPGQMSTPPAADTIVINAIADTAVAALLFLL